MTTTIRDAERCITGLSGAIVLASPTIVHQFGNPVYRKANALGRKIADDNGVVFGSEEFDTLPLDTLLTPCAEQMLAELRSCKQALL